MLNRAGGGIMCLTRKSLLSTWLPFEAGRISARKKGFVIPYYLDIDPNEINFPLGLFQALEADEDGTRDLVLEIYEALPHKRITVVDFRKRFEDKWPTLLKKLEATSREVARIRGGSQLQRFESAVQEGSNNYHKAEEIAEEIAGKKYDINQHERFVIALCGSAAIGKSTFADHLAWILETKKRQTVSILPTDAFSFPRALKRANGWQGYEPISHKLKELNEAVGKLIAGNSVICNPYQHETGTRAAPKEVQPAKILIVEGVYSFAPMNDHEIGWRPGDRVAGCRIYLYAEPGKAQELKFAADVTSRGKSVEEAFKELGQNYASYDKHIKKIYHPQSPWEIEVNQYWAYR
jgi:uridine kinase